MSKGSCSIFSNLLCSSHSFHISVFACSLNKQITMATMNSNFCLGFVISLMRYLLFIPIIHNFIHRQLIILIYVMFAGITTANDCCDLILDIPNTDRIYFYSYLMLILISSILLNFQTLHFIIRTKKNMSMKG
ncbi:hypothetical protein PMAYCL1PPCAC_14089, partial [Pristionchus mayeri]